MAITRTIKHFVFYLNDEAYATSTINLAHDSFGRGQLGLITRQKGVIAYKCISKEEQDTLLAFEAIPYVAPNEDGDGRTIRLLDVEDKSMGDFQIVLLDVNIG
jgi:hypothetical protein